MGELVWLDLCVWRSTVGHVFEKLDLSGCRLMKIPDSVREHVALEESITSFNA